MIIFDLTAVPETDKAKLHWRFTLVIACGPGTLHIPGWRYYPDTEFLKPPQRLQGRKWVPTCNMSKPANEALINLVQDAFKLKVVELDSILARLTEMEPEARAAKIEELRTDSYAGAAVVWTWEKGRN